MQFYPAPGMSAGPARARAELAAKSLLRGSAAAGPRENDLRTLVHEDRLREEESQRRRGALDGSTPLASSGDVIRCEERRIETGSRAFQRGEARQHAGQQAAASRHTFREALHDAHRPGGANPDRPDAGAGGRPGAAVPAHADTRSASAQSSDLQGSQAVQTVGRGRVSTPLVADSQSPPSPPSGKPAVTARPPAQGSTALVEAEAAKLLSQTISPGAGGVSGSAPAQSQGLTAASSGPGSATTVQTSTTRSEMSGTHPTPSTSATRPSPRPAATLAGHALKPAAAESAEREARIERIVRLIRGEIGRERSRATLRLDPPELGTIRMHMDLQKDRLLLRVDTQSDVAHRLLTEDVEALRAALAQSGIHLEKVEIRPPPQRFDLPDDAGTRSPPEEGSNRQDAEQSAMERRDSGLEAHATGGLTFAEDGAERAPGEEARSTAEPRLNLWA
jgi:hypothetical protein